MAKAQDVLLRLVEDYDKARRAANEATREKDEINKEIKLLLGDKTTAAVPGWRVSYAYDKDKEVTLFDEEKFESKDPKGYKTYVEMLKAIEILSKKYTKTKTIPGSRKLLVESEAE